MRSKSWQIGRWYIGVTFRFSPSVMVHIAPWYFYSEVLGASACVYREDTLGF